MNYTTNSVRKMNFNVKEEKSDPDYDVIQQTCVNEVNESLHREDAREQTTQKIREIISDQFSFEINLKEKEVTTLNQRVNECRGNLDRMRACILAGYYGYGIKSAGQLSRKSLLSRRRNVKESSIHNIMNWKRSLPSNLDDQPCAKYVLNQGKTEQNLSDSSQICSDKFSDSIKMKKPEANESRFYVKRKIIVGNTSKFIHPEQREGNDRSTHKWMVYVRGTKDDDQLEKFINKVWFLLHPSYQPNDLVEVSKPPFQVTRRGWGEFPVRVQLHFVNCKNKRVDIIHHLKLDKSYTGLQTLGSETHVEIELDRKNFEGSYHSNQHESLGTVKACSDVNTTLGLSSSSFNEQTKKVTLDKCSPSTQLDQQVSSMDTDVWKHGVMNDHSYSTIHAEENLNCDDNIKYLPPLTSKPGSKCSTHYDIKSKQLMSVESESLLKTCILQCPLVTTENISVKRGYRSNSVDEYLSWNLGKRLAGEWQRALDIKNRIEQQPSAKMSLTSPSCVGLKISTKEIMNYCRHHGYTPMMESCCEETTTLCKICGEFVGNGDRENEEAMIHTSCLNAYGEGISNDYMSAEEFLEMIKNCKNVFKKCDMVVDEDKDSEMIDVVGLPCDVMKNSSNHHEVSFLPSTQEHEWIQNVAKEIDVTLTNNDIDSVHAPVTSAMLHKACCMFVEDIVRKANRFMWKSSLEIPKAKCIVPYHVKQALNALSYCDFLTNNYLKVAMNSSQY